MKKKPKTIPCEFRDPKLPQFGSLPLDLSDEAPTASNVLPQQPQPSGSVPGDPLQMQ